MKSVIINQKYFMPILVAVLITFVFTGGTTVYSLTPVSDRTPEVRDAIVAAVPGVNSAADVTEAHLAAITTLNLYDAGVTSIKVGDFDGLTALTKLRLSFNDLSSLPDGIFSGLTALTRIELRWNDLSSLPGDIFSGLTALTRIDLRDNDLSSLPDGIFSGLTMLQRLEVSRNPGAPFALAIFHEKVGEGQFKVVAPTGTPLDRVLPIIVNNGTLSGVATTVTLSAGSVESEPFTVTRIPGTTAPVTVNIGTVPDEVPTDVNGIPLHTGYVFVKSSDLPIEVISAIGGNLAPVFTEGSTATRAVAENTPSDGNIGDPIEATDPNNDVLTYTLGGTNRSSFRIDSSSGQLRTRRPLDYETKDTYTVTVNVSDSNEGNASITLTINITDVPSLIAGRSPWVVRDLIAHANTLEREKTNGRVGIDSEDEVTEAHLTVIADMSAYVSEGIYRTASP